MQCISNVLRSIFILTVFSGFVYGTTSSENPDQVELTIEVIKDCMAKSPDLWPDEWKKEYIDTIRKAVESHHDASHYTMRLEILGKSFVPYWEGFTKTKDRSLFEVYRTRIRWYTEHLMGTKFPTEEERQKLHDQYKDLWNNAADSLLKQFTFLDLNAVQNAKQDDLSQCYRKIEAPLMPVYLRPMSEENVELKVSYHKEFPLLSFRVSRDTQIQVILTLTLYPPIVSCVVIMPESQTLIKHYCKL